MVDLFALYRKNFTITNLENIDREEVFDTNIIITSKINGVNNSEIIIAGIHKDKKTSSRYIQYKISR